MKKLFAVLLCVLLLPLLPALAEEAASVPLFRLTTVDEQGREMNLGSALLVEESNWLITSAPVAEPMWAYAPDGTAYAVALSLPFDGGFTYLVLERDTGVTPAPLLLESDVEHLTLAGVTVNGLRYSAPAESRTTTRYLGGDALLVSASEPLLPGAVLVNDRLELTGMVVADWGEGENRYVALMGEALWRAMGLLDNQEELLAADDPWLRDVRLEVEAGVLSVDWSDCAIADLGDDSEFTVYLQDLKNAYYSYYALAADRFSMEIPVVPGREYAIWVRHTHGEDAGQVALTLERAVEISAPELGAYTDFNFTDECYLATYPINEIPEMTEQLPPLESITADALSDISRSLYLQVVNTYQVEEELEANMIFYLHTPEDYMFFSISGYIFMPDIQGRDVWSADITELFADYLTYGSKTYVPGTYEVGYAIDGAWGGAFSFTLE